MEATQNLKTSDAWRLALSLTCADAQRFAGIIKDICKYVGIILYLTIALGLTFSECDDTIAFNLIGISMILLAGLKAKKYEDK